MSAERWAYAQDDRVRYADLDPRGHLNNVALLSIFEAARIMYIRDRLSEADARDLILVSQHIDYRSPGALDDPLRTRLRPGEIKRKTFRLEFEVHHTGEERLVADGHGIYIGYDYDANGSQALSAELVARLREDMHP